MADVPQEVVVEAEEAIEREGGSYLAELEALLDGRDRRFIIDSTDNLTAYQLALMGFDFADQGELLRARAEFAEQTGSEPNGLAHAWEFAAYAFCPTGERGGIDNSCSPEGSDGGVADLKPTGREWMQNAVKTSQFPVRQPSGKSVKLIARVKDIGRFEGRDSVIIDTDLSSITKVNAFRRLKLLLDNAFEGYKVQNPKAHAPDIFRDGVEIDKEFADWLNIKYKRQWQETNLSSLILKRKRLEINGQSFLQSFQGRFAMDLTPGSTSRRIFEKYLELRENNNYDCVYCGLKRYPLPGQHDQCDHSPTGECVDPEWQKQLKEKEADSKIETNTETVIKAVGIGKRDAANLYSKTFDGGRTVSVLSEHYIKKGARGLADYVDFRGGPDTQDTLAKRPAMVDKTPYQNYAAAAIHLVGEIRNAPVSSKILYRGVGAKDGIPELETAKVGQTLSIPRIASFSQDDRQAAYYTPRGYRNYLLKLTGPTKGLETDSLTGMRHKEVITQGKFEIVSVEPGRSVKLPPAYRGSTLFLKVITLHLF